VSNAIPLTTARGLKCTFLRVCAALGLFRLTGMLFARRLQILCYHGFQLADECRFRPQLFISEDTFIGRLQHLAREGFVVLPLGEALTRMWNGTLPRRSLVITIDDGFKSTLSVAAPILLRFDLPATVYVTTYYMEKNVPVFRLAMQYLFWRASARLLDPVTLELLAALDSQLADRQLVLSATGCAAPDNRESEVPLHDAASQQLIWNLIQRGEALNSESERQSLLREVGRILADTLSLDELQSLSIMSGEEIFLLARQGFDIQLHTHRHRFPSHDRSIACQEIIQNQSRLEAITGRKARHFCYPSGIFASSQWAWLQELGIESATTCLSGLNTARTPRYALRRFLDSEDISFVEFKAEMAGFSELLHRVRAWITLGHSPTARKTGRLPPFSKASRPQR
jgi:peptidoglycan/xylan/chitin deacetylase (PgdA/CDA1 family)